MASAKTKANSMEYPCCVMSDDRACTLLTIYDLVSAHQPKDSLTASNSNQGIQDAFDLPASQIA